MEIIMTLETARQLRQAGQHEEARQSLVALLGATPDDPVLNYEAACAHDYLGLEREAVPFYERAIANGLTGEPLQGALLGLGSTYRALGDYEKAMATFRLGLERVTVNSRPFWPWLSITRASTTMPSAPCCST
jgi:tetratricopeptide (TPR) repeat protein